MAATWGRATVVLTVDGKDLVAQTYAYAKQAGDAGGEAMEKEFDKHLTDMGSYQLNRLRERAKRSGTASGRILGTTVATAMERVLKGRIDTAVNEIAESFAGIGDFDRFVQGFDSVGEAAGRMRSNLELAREEGRLTEAQYNVLSDELNKHTVRLLEAEQANEDATSREKDANKERNRSLSLWRRLSHNTRQWTLIISTVAAALPALSVLSSALSGTIIALGAAIAGLVAGIGLAVVGFAGLYNSELDLSEGAIASRDALSELGTALSDLQEGITNSMFDDMATSISNVTDTLIPALEESINTFAGQVGDSLGSVFDALSSPLAIQNFKDLLEEFGPIFDNLVQAAIGFGSGIAGVLVAALPTAVSFTEAIAEVGEAFGTWANSEEGRTRLAEFFETASTIMPPLIELVVSLAGMLANLVTEETINSVVTLLNSLISFVPSLEGILQVLAGLDLFGVLAAALDAVGAALAPILPILIELANIIGTQLVAAFQLWQPALAAITEAVAPVIAVISVLMTAILPVLIDIINVALESLAEIAEAFINTGGDADDFSAVLEVVGTVVGIVFQAIGNIIKTAMTTFSTVLNAIAKLLRGDFQGAFQAVFDGVAKILGYFGIDINDVIKFVNDMVSKVSKFLSDLWKNVSKVFDNIGDAFEDVGDVFEDIGQAIEDVFSGIGDAISRAIGWIGDLAGAIGRLDFGAIGQLFGGGGGGGFASGGVLLGPRRILAGEAGPEAIVPLRRNLSQVDPSVRALSAIAQGMTPMGGGGIVGNGGSSRIVNIGQGAVQVVEAGSARQTAYNVLDVLAKRIAG